MNTILKLLLKLFQLKKIFFGIIIGFCTFLPPSFSFKVSTNKFPFFSYFLIQIFLYTMELLLIEIKISLLFVMVLN